MENLRETYGAEVPLFDSYLRAKQPLLNNKSQYDFNIVLQSGGQAVLPELKLQITDAFYCYAIGLFLEREETAKPGKAVLQTYPNETYFPVVVGPPAFTPADLEAIYNGYMQIQVNQTVICQYLPTSQFRTVDTTLQSGTNNKSERHVDDGFVELEPNLKLAGSQNIKISVVMPSWANIAIESQSAGFVNNLVLMPLGFLIPNESAIFAKSYK
jgi:hypothetical protein